MEIGGELKNDILSKLYKFLTYQERCRFDIVQKLNRLNIDENYHQQYIQHLEEENFLNEQRYCQSYVNGKIRSNKWGKRKIKFSLQHKRVDVDNMNKALADFPSEEYQQIANTIANKKSKSLKETDPNKHNQKVYNYLAQKGFENETIKKALNSLKKR